MISDQAVRDRVTHDNETLFAVDAGAGTGKTTLLVSRLIALLLEKEASLSRIAAITFTEKAAAELAERLRSKLEKALSENPAQKDLILKAIEDMEKAPISTIHSFCASLLREYPVEAGVDPQFTLLDEVQSGAFETQAWEHWLKKNLAHPVEPLFQFLRIGGTFEQVDELKQFLKRNRTLLSNPSPKTLPSVEPFREKWKAFLAWSRKEAAHCTDHADTLYKPLEKFWDESQNIEFLNKPSPLAGEGRVRGHQEGLLHPHPGLLPSREKETTDADFDLASLKIPKTSNKGAQKNWGKERLAEMRDGFVRLAEDHTEAFGPFKEAVVLNLIHWIGGYLTEWESQKAQGGFLDFDDLLLKTRDLLRDHPEAREEIKERLDYLFVDEFQDTDPLQVEIVFFLSEKTGRQEKDWRKMKLEPGKLFLVGDPKQSIYRFRRADVTIYEETKKRILANGGKVEVLTENFRTVGGLVEWVNGRFPSLFEGTGIGYNPLSANREKGKTEGTLPILWGLSVPVPEDAPETKAYFRQQEAEWVAAFLKEKILGGGWTLSDPKTHQIRPVQKGDIAVLFRDLSNDNEEFWEEALRKRDLAYQIVGGKRFFNRPEIVALSTLLTCLSSPADEAVCVAVLRGPLFGFSDEALFKHRASCGSFLFQDPTAGKMKKAFGLLIKLYEATRTLGVSETLSEIYKETNLLAITAGQPHGEQRVANLMKVLDQARDLETSQHFTYRAFTQWLTTQQEEETMEGEAPGTDSSEDRITLMTIHKAKGLEFPIVFVSAWASDPKDSGSLVDRKHSAGAFKVGKADLGLKSLNYDTVKQEEELQRHAEDTRLLYVAATRARDCLLLSHFNMPPECKFQNEGLFTGPLLKALEEGGALVHWAEAESQEEALGELPAWVVPLEGKLGDPTLTAEKEKLKAQQQARKEKLESLRGQREFKSVTSVLAGDEEKRQREERIFTEPEVSSPWGGKDLGSFAHLLLEKGWDWDGPTLQKAALVYAERMGVPQPESEKAVEWVEKALRSEIIARARKSGKVFRELPMTGAFEKGTFLNAVLDLAFLEADEWVVVDYKTDQDMEKGKEKYKEQLGYYRELLEKFTDHKVKEVFLYFIRHNEIVRV
jgi:ATP-dependent helicase/nuclease subunit A